MKNRLSQNDVTNRVNVESPAAVRDAVLALYAARYPGADLSVIERAFADIEALFEGRFPGYLACDTLYHDLRHTLDMTLATARLIEAHDRVHAAPERLGVRRAILGVVIALLHDSGYLKRTSEAHIENGAVFTKTHVTRSGEFLRRYLPTLGYGAEADLAAELVHFTGYERDLDDIKVESGPDRLLGCIVGTADLIGQMSDRMYLEKCRAFLYEEFVWGSVARERLPDGREIVRYASADDLIFKTPGFYEYVARERILNKLGAQDRYAAVHFGGPNLYQEEIDRNMRYLRDTLASADLSRLRRACYSLSQRQRKAA
ncbi:MAG: hypothetical protein N2653_11890 [Burkholderiales bacterium]|nr:hypothetical protein [Burkholderiales bacterium]